MLSRSCQKATAKIMILITRWSNQFCVVILAQPILPTYTSCTWKNLFLCHTILPRSSCATTAKSLSAVLLQPLMPNTDIKKIISGWHLTDIFITEANYIYLDFRFHLNRQDQASPVIPRAAKSRGWSRNRYHESKPLLEKKKWLAWYLGNQTKGLILLASQSWTTFC